MTYFSKVSLGNIGQNQDSCGGVNILNEQALKLSCSFGKLEALISFGLSASDDSIADCSIGQSDDKDDEYEYLHDKCNVLFDGKDLNGSLFQNSGYTTQLVDYFNAKCKGNSGCRIPISNSLQVQTTSIKL